MSGSLVLTGDDYEFLREAEYFKVQCCQEINLKVERKCSSGESELFYQGYFTLYDIDWDLDNRTATVKKISTMDAYSIVFARYSEENNWLEGAVPYIVGRDDPNVERQPLTPFRYPFVHSEELNPRTENRQDRARHFNTALQWLIRKTFRGTAYESYADATPLQFSQFLNAPTNPVTNEPNFLNQVTILHISDAKRPGATNPASMGKISLKAVLDDLKKLYNAYWFIDEDGRFRIEHITYFPYQSYTAPVISLDFTEVRFKEVMAGNKRYSYQTDKLKGREGITLTISESAQNSVSKVREGRLSDATMEFDAAYMSYSESCVPKDDKGEKTTEYQNVSNFVTNWPAVVLHPDTLPDDGWVLVNIVFSNTGTTLPYRKLPISKVNTESGAMAATSLFYKFGRYDCSFAYGIFSAQKEKSKTVTSSSVQVTERPLNAKTVKRIKALPDVELPICGCGEEYDWTGIIKHPLADNCMVQQLEYDLITQTVTASLLGSNVCTDNPYPDYDEDQDPTAGCPVYGKLLRQEQSTKSLEGDSQYYQYVITYTDFFADGSCGEYSSSRQEMKRIPKRGNGPR